MDEIHILVSWKIGSQSYVSKYTAAEYDRNHHVCVRVNHYPHIWKMDCPWNHNDAPTIVRIIRSEYLRNIQVSGVLAVYNATGCIKRAKDKFLKNISSGQREIILPVQNFLTKEFRYPCWNFEIHGFITVSESNGQQIELNCGTQKFERQTLEKLSSDLESLYGDNPMSFVDVILKCDNAVVPAHRNILSARSPVFAAMFRNEMTENQSGTVNITDITHSTLRTLLVYMYCGKIQELTTATAAELVFAADKYQLQGLKEICTDYLRSNMSLHNVLQVLAVGDLHDATLKRHVVEFVCKDDNFSAIEKSKDWKILKAENTSLALEVLTSVIKYLHGNK